MNALEQLARIQVEACMSCGTMRPECWVPATDDSGMTWPCCWLCAHAIVEHGMALGGELTDCGCKREDVYPADVLAHMDGRSLFAEPAQDRTQKPAPEKSPAEFLTLTTPMHDRRGRVVESAPMLVQTFRKLDADTVVLEHVELRPRVKRVGRALVKRGT